VVSEFLYAVPNPLPVGEGRVRVSNYCSYTHQYEYTKIVIAKKFELLCVDSRMSTSPAASSENHRVTLRRQLVSHEEWFKHCPLISCPLQKKKLNN